MRRKVGLIGFSIIATIAFSHLNAAPLGASKMTPEQREEANRIRRERMRRNSGGTVFNLAAQKGVIMFLNAQDKVPSAPLDKRINTMRDFFSTKFVLKQWKKPITLSNAQATLEESKANAAVFIVDDPSVPVTILSAPETKWIFLNVAALNADSPDPKLLMERTRRELWRALGFLMNGSLAEVCVMRAVTSLKELDELGAEAPSSGPIVQISRRMKDIGVTPIQRATYYRALREGWAPMPTNVYQRALYDKYQQEIKSRK